MCLNTNGKYGKVTDTEINLSIISKSVMVIFFVEFIDQLIDYHTYMHILNRYIFSHFCGVRNELQHQKCTFGCVPSKDSDQHVHLLI